MFYERFGKRCFDFCMSLIILLLLIPLYPFLACLLLILTGKPILFKQTRTGQLNRPFQILKFRSMKSNLKKQKLNKLTYSWTDGVPDDFVFKSPLNAEITGFGGFIRKTSIDELPQLLNVLRGDMSLIGPRPEIPEITDCYNEKQKKRLMLKPGMTGWAQVNGRADSSHGRKIEHDLYYINNCSFLLDMKILMRTIVIILKCKGAY